MEQIQQVLTILNSGSAAVFSQAGQDQDRPDDSFASFEEMAIGSTTISTVLPQLQDLCFRRATQIRLRSHKG